MKAFTFLIGLSALTAAPAPAEPVKVDVTVMKSDLSTADGRRRTQRKIADVIDQLCRSYAAVEPYQFPEVDDCRRRAKASADLQIARALGREKQVRLSNR